MNDLNGVSTSMFQTVHPKMVSEKADTNQIVSVVVVASEASLPQQNVVVEVPTMVLYSATIL